MFQIKALKAVASSTASPDQQPKRASLAELNQYG
jgi:hypothetical protein